MVFENILCYKWNPQPEEGEAGRGNSQAKLSSAPVSGDLWLRIGGERKRMENTREYTIVIFQSIFPNGSCGHRSQDKPKLSSALTVN